MGISRKKEIVAMANKEILQLIYYNGEGLMAKQHVVEYMKRIFSWSEYRTAKELKELVDYEIIERKQLHRMAFYRLSRYGKGIVLGKKKTSEFSDTPKENSAMVRSLILNDFGLNRIPESQFQSETMLEFFPKIDKLTTIFYRQKEAYLILKQYHEAGILELSPPFKAEYNYLVRAQKAGITGNKMSKEVERPPLFHKQVTYHGLQQMNIHINGPLKRNGKVVGFEFLFFQLNVKLTGAEVFERITKASAYLKLFLSIPEQQGVWLQFRMICNNDDTMERYKKYYEKHKHKLNEVAVEFEFLDLDNKYFNGNRVLLTV